MPEQITIGGEIFQVPLRYQEGHQINALEAKMLNQVFHGALRNNWAPKIKAAKENGKFDKIALQAKLTDYAVQYQFGGRLKSAAAPKDKAMPEAMSMARALVRAELKRKGISLRNVSGASIAEYAGKYLANHPELIQEARTRLQGTPDLSSLVADMPVKG